MLSHLHMVLLPRCLSWGQSAYSGSSHGRSLSCKAPRRTAVVLRGVLVESVQASLDLLDVRSVFGFTNIVFMKRPLYRMVHHFSALWSKISRLQFIHHLLVSFSSPIELGLLLPKIHILFGLVLIMLFGVDESKGHDLFFLLVSCLLDGDWVATEAEFTNVHLLFSLFT